MHAKNLSANVAELQAELRGAGLQLPELVIRAMEFQWWGAHRVDAPALRTAMNLHADTELRFRFELSCESLRRHRSVFEYLERDGEQRRWARITKNSAWRAHDRLPWLNIDYAVPFGEGADIGDDLWLVLDYRTSPSSPRIIYNQIKVRQIRRQTEFRWVELAKSFEDFLQLIDVPAIQAE